MNEAMNVAISIESLEVREGDIDAFFEVPFTVYARFEPYVSPMRSDLLRFLDTSANPAFESADDLAVFTVHRDGKALGRLTAHVHRASQRRHAHASAFFGYFDCIDDTSLAHALLDRAEGWANARGCDELIGNVEMTAMQQMGVQTSGFAATPYTDQHCNPAHIARQLETHGFTRDFPMRTFEACLDSVDPDRLLGAAQRAILDDEAFTFAPIERRSLKNRLCEAHGLLNAAFVDNPGFVALSDEEFAFQSGEMRWIMDRRISAVLHYLGEPVGTVICIPDLSGFVKATRSRFGLMTPWHYLRHVMHRERAVLIFYAVHPDFQGRGINGALLHRVVVAMQAVGYRTMGCTWIGDDNKASLRQMEKLGAQELHGLHLFRKRLTPISAEAGESATGEMLA